MTLMEGFAKDEIIIDFGAEILYGSDQCYRHYRRSGIHAQTERPQ